MTKIAEQNAIIRIISIFMLIYNLYRFFNRGGDKMILLFNLKSWIVLE
jgi:hypothetical protein